MKGRKKGETDAQYIARLEAANADLRRDNKLLSERMGLFTDRAAPAADFAGAVLNAAAEVAGLRDDPRVKSAAEVLSALAGLPWSKDIPRPDTSPAFGRSDPMANGADAEMVVASVYEAIQSELGHPVEWMSFLKGASERDRRAAGAVFCKLSTLARANLSDQARNAAGLLARPLMEPPKVETLEEAREVVADLWMAVGNELGDLAMSRSCLRLDLRAAMYDDIFDRLAHAVNASWAAVQHLPLPKRAEAAWESF